MITLNQITILTDFCLHVLALLDRSVFARVALIDAFKNKDVEKMTMLKHRYNLNNDEDAEALIKEASEYILNIKGDIRMRFKSYGPEQLRSMINNQEFGIDFLRKYIKTEEEYKDDKFLQCN